ncbi:hypothetical protein B0T17DRAFT_310682 [Bombardia bombarda]|uniref:Uncharacterized protein n=1 Tax=Bombardia bombarda TaxID=252184 RepID=A0AA39WLY4_9PEZI|nr:hypothetical protein B0T17DRAFT_310682 [Bombardia bombarda]
MGRMTGMAGLCAGPEHFASLDKVGYEVFVFWQTKYFGRQNTLADKILWQTKYFGRQNTLADKILWQTKYFGRQNTLADKILWQTKYFGTSAPPECSSFNWSLVSACSPVAVAVAVAVAGGGGPSSSPKYCA